MNNVICKACPEPVKRKSNIFCSHKCASFFNGNKPPHPKGKNHPRWKGGSIDRSGYRFIHKPDHPFSGKQGYIAEHRIIMESIIGRYLLPGEVVHHINEDKTDNRPENLRLYASPGQHTLSEHIDILKKTWKKMKGKHFSPKTEFKKGQIPWNKKIHKKTCVT